MPDSEYLLAIINRIINHQHSDDDLAVLRQEISTSSSKGTFQIGKYNVNIGEGQGDIHIGDRIYQGTDAEAIKEALRLVLQEKQKAKRPRTEKLLLQAVKEEVAARLKQSLHNAVLINLGKEAQPEQVKRPWSSDIKIGDKPSEPIPEEKSILEVFDQEETAGKLLILGNPGAGKTTTMLDLAKALIARAEQDADYPIPVLFNLSNWKDDKQSIGDWLVVELKTKYGVRKDIGAKWVSDVKLLPMLDGLDELEPLHQETCVIKINEFLQSDFRPQYLVVCSRKEEYGIHRTHLGINGAIYLKSLNKLEIKNYLIEVGIEELWNIISNDDNFLDVVRVPLFLSITTLVYQELSPEEWENLQSNEYFLEEILWDAYVYQMSIRELNYNRHILKYSSRKTYVWLSWLANNLINDFKTEFLIEEIQPDWLETELHEKIYTGINCLILLIILCLFCLSSNLAIGIIVWLKILQFMQIKIFSYIDSWSLKDARIGLILGIFSGCYLELKNKYFTFCIDNNVNRNIDFSNTVELIKRFVSHISPDIFSYTLAAVLVGRFVFEVIKLQSKWYHIRLALVIFFNIVAWDMHIILFVIDMLQSSNICKFILIINIIVAGIIGGVIGGLICGLFFQTAWKVLFGVLEVKMELSQVQLWSFKNIRKGLFSGLKFGALFGFVIGIIDNSSITDTEIIANSDIWASVSNSIIQRLHNGLIYAVFLALLMGLFGTFGNGDFVKPASEKMTVFPNQGIRTAFKQATITGLSALVISFASIFFNLNNLIYEIVTSVLIAWLMNGGYICIQHITLRLILYFNGNIPWNYAHFLDYCTERQFLQRVGGRYRFIHRFLQEHFAEMPDF